ncbi:MAG: hypothetical protein MUD06_03615 [Rhodospirillales bacterium]|jgi:hypothetical protein|nr:hypothetical protein [Rhodospirillales bacterium]
MEDPQNETSVAGAGGDAGSSKGGARLIRGGNSAAGADAEAQAAETASAVAGSILHAGRRAAAGTQATVAAAEEAAADVGRDLLDEWLGYAHRAYIRNAQALGELLYCRTPLGLLRWQSNLLGETLSDLKDTNSRVLRLASTKP